MHPYDSTPHGPTPHADLRPTGDRPLPWAVFASFHRAMHAHRQLMARMMAERDIPPAQALCLRVLGHSDGMTQSDLATALGVSRPTVTVMLQKMEKSGVVERRADEADQRYTRIFLTDAGRASHEQMHRLLDSFVAETGGRLAESDQRELVRLLDLLSAEMSRTLAEHPRTHHPHDHDFDADLRRKETTR